MSQITVKHPALIQLAALGYKPSDKVYIRLLPPKASIPELKELGYQTYKDQSGNEQISKFTGYYVQDGDLFFQSFGKRGYSKYKNGLSRIQHLASKGYGVYLVVNPGGNSDGEIIRCDNLFFENDIIDIEAQKERLTQFETLLGKSATFVLRTKKSLHTYLRLDESLEPEVWTGYQQRLIQHLDSDPSIWNPSRLMRLAGFDHFAVENGRVVATPIMIEDQSESTFSIEEIDAVLPNWDKERWQPKKSSEAALPSSPIDNAWDIRNFAKYLDGYNPTGRQGWITCKCPNDQGDHKGGSVDSLHINESTGQFKCWAKCSTQQIYHAAKYEAIKSGYELPEKKAVVITKEQYQQTKEASTKTMIDDLSTSLEEKEAIEDAKLKAEIDIYIATTDPVRRMRMKGKICRAYSVPTSEFDKAVTAQQMQGSILLREPKAYKGREILSRRTELTRYLIDGWLKKKSSLVLTGLAGAQKTLLAMRMAKSVLYGDLFLEEKSTVERGKVLFIIPDQPTEETIDYLIDMGFDMDDDNWEIFEDWNINYLLELEKKLDEFQPDLVICDSVRATITGPLGISENDAIVGGYMKKVQDLVEKYGTCIWIHHDNKNTNVSGVAKSSGHGSITSTPSQHWSIERVAADDPSNTMRRLRTHKSRGMAGQNLFIDFDPNEYDFTIRNRNAGDMTDENKSIGERVIAYLKGKPNQWVEHDELRQALNGNPNLKMALKRLRDAGKVQYQINPQRKKGMSYIYETDDLSTDSSSECNWHNGNNEKVLSIGGVCENECYQDSESIDIYEFEDGNSDGNITVTSSVTEINLGNIDFYVTTETPVDTGLEGVTENQTESMSVENTETVTSVAAVTVCTQIVEEVEQFSYAEFCLDRIPQAELVKLQNHPQISLDASGVVREVLDDSYMLDFGSGLVEVKKAYMRPAFEL